MSEPTKSQNSSSHERAVKGYLRPSLQPKFDNYVKTHELSVSEALNAAVKLLVEQDKSAKK